MGMLGVILLAQTVVYGVETPEGTVHVTMKVEGIPSHQALRKEILIRLAALEKLVRTWEHPRRRTRALTLLREIRALVYAYDHPGELHPLPPEGESFSTISREALDDLIEALEDADFDEDQLRILRTAARKNYFQVRQVVRILEALDFEDTRLEAVRILWPRVVDRENAHELYEAFDFSSSREELEDILEE